MDTLPRSWEQCLTWQVVRVLAPCMHAWLPVPQDLRARTLQSTRDLDAIQQQREKYSTLLAELTRQVRQLRTTLPWRGVQQHKSNVGVSALE